MLVDAKNSFNKINQVGMLWTVRQLWVSRACFVFHYYPHWSFLVLRNRGGEDSIMHIREGVTQGNLLAMIAYGIIIFPLINNLKQEIPDGTQPWYADNARDLGTFRKN